ncbi:uncharacterized protein LOC110720220 [Chenopodium quinoa]|uniref:uncharacterized protein LOC110720220 n=1 Tax=Chenopodium quinoa TaxID=63459 RepID=UPI000B7821A7|nr:uncharacterized protein LOC110720220 [Chenopodium quinoa]
MYVKVENTRLDFRKNQHTIRADLYQGILDTISCGENCAANVGRKVILPPTFIGGPQDLKKRYLNAMSLVQRFGKPDLFITMTYNANWPEIKQELDVGEKAQDRPDIVARIFRAKVLALKHLIIKKNVFREVAAMIYVIEFQKRGLPHAHFLVILKQDYKIKCPSDFDKFVCAEIPYVANSYLRKVILKHMMHCPCGHLDPDCPCMKHKESRGRCKYGYPKQLCDEIRNSRDGYPMYRRKDTRETVTVQKIVMDNKWVIPYNPYLSSHFDCHLNVEVCSTIEVVKYFYNYVYKGHDIISFNVVQFKDVVPAQDEIEQYQSGRWVSPCEAAWRLFGFDMYEMLPPVLPLPVNLPNSQIIQLRPHEQLTLVISDDKRSRTCLTEFFRMNAKLPSGTGLLYNEFSEHYHWDASDKYWYKRQNKKIVIGRLEFVGPSEGERYFLRLLLHNVKSPKSFEDLRTVNGHVFYTFHQAALKLKLLEEDDSVDLCLKEGCDVQMPLAVRKLFATVLIFCQPSDPVSHWMKYYTFLSGDFKHKYPSNPQKFRHLIVKSVEWFLESMGSSLAKYGLDHLVEPNDDEIRITKDIDDALNAPIPEQCLECKNQLNQALREAFDVIMDHVTRQVPGAFFINGPGGTSKTFLYNALYAEIRLMNSSI